MLSALQIERELVLSAEKGSSKIPLMHEPRTPAGPRRTHAGIPLLPRSAGSIAPDHPPKQMQQAWVRKTDVQSTDKCNHARLSVKENVPQSPRIIRFDQLNKTKTTDAYLKRFYDAAIVTRECLLSYAFVRATCSA